MASITFFRHAKSELPHTGIDDFDRVLAPRGRRNAVRMGEFLQQNNMLSELVLVSTAARTRETYELASAGWPELPVAFEDDIYAASAETLFRVILRNASDRRSVMVIGHNPGLVVLLHQLLERYPPTVNMSYFPTSCVASIGFDADSLGKAEAETARLLSFSRVRELDKSYGL